MSDRLLSISYLFYNYEIYEEFQQKSVQVYAYNFKRDVQKYKRNTWNDNERLKMMVQQKNLCYQ